MYKILILEADICDHLADRDGRVEICAARLPANERREEEGFREGVRPSQIEDRGKNCHANKLVNEHYHNLSIFFRLHFFQL